MKRPCTRRTILAAAPAPALALAASPARAQKNTAPASPTPRSRSATPCPIAARPRPTARSARPRPPIFKMINDRGRHQRPQDQLHLLRRRLHAAEDRRAGAQAGRAGRGAARVQPARHADQHRDPPIHEPEEGAAAVRRHRRHQMGRPEGLSLDDGLAAQLPERRPHLRHLHPQEKPDAKIGVLYQNDDFGKDYLKGLKDGLGDKAQDDRRRGAATRRPTRPSIRRSSS